MFCSAEPCSPAWTFSSSASALRAARYLREILAACPATHPGNHAMQANPIGVISMFYARPFGTMQLAMLPRMKAAQLIRLVVSASTVDGIVKGLGHPLWPTDTWEALRKLALQLTQLAAGEKQAA